MRRTNIYLEDDQHERIAEIAERRGVAQAVVIREFVAKGLKGQNDSSPEEKSRLFRATAGALSGDDEYWESWLKRNRPPASERLAELGLE